MRCTRPYNPDRPSLFIQSQWNSDRDFFFCFFSYLTPQRLRGAGWINQRPFIRRLLIALSVFFFSFLFWKPSKEKTFLQELWEQSRAVSHSSLSWIIYSLINSDFHRSFKGPNTTLWTLNLTASSYIIQNKSTDQLQLPRVSSL